MNLDPIVAACDAPAIEAILRQQDGVIRPEQVSSALSRGKIRHAVRAGRWSMPHRGVYVAHNAQLTPGQERWVCLLSGPPGAALGGLTAAELDGLSGFEQSEVYVVVPGGARPPRRAGMVVKWSSKLTTLDVHPARCPRRTRLARSLVDAASWQRPERRARAIILAGVQQRLVRPSDLLEALGRRGRCWRGRLIGEAIHDAEGGVASIPEHDFEQIRRMFGLPEPQRQAIVQRSDGRFYLDAHWRRYAVGAEIHGMPHMEVLNWDADLDRQAVLMSRGQRILQFTSYAVRHDKTRVGELLVQSFRRAGWPGRGDDG